MNAATRRPSTLEEAALRLAREFKRFCFGTQRTSDGKTSLAAVRQKMDEPGLTAFITDDPQEMREALEEDRDSPLGQQAPPSGG